MKINYLLGCCLLMLMLMLSMTTYAGSIGKIKAEESVIPLLPDARVFAQFSDEMPFVINYFTGASETEIIDFYQQAFDQAVQQQRKRGRILLVFQSKQKQQDIVIRVIISTQDGARQVDVIQALQ
jgi:hypothetical protein